MWFINYTLDDTPNKMWSLLNDTPNIIITTLNDYHTQAGVSYTHFDENLLFRDITLGNFRKCLFVSASYFASYLFVCLILLDV